MFFASDSVRSFAENPSRLVTAIGCVQLFRCDNFDGVESKCSGQSQYESIGPAANSRGQMGPAFDIRLSIGVRGRSLAYPDVDNERRQGKKVQTAHPLTDRTHHSIGDYQTKICY